MFQRVVELPNALPTHVAGAYCNHGHLVQTRAGVDCALLEEGLTLFRRYDYTVFVANVYGTQSEVS